MLNSQKAQELFTGLLGEVLKIHNPKLSEKFDLEGVRHLARRGAKFNEHYHEVLTEVVVVDLAPHASINTETPEGIERLLKLMTDLNNLTNFVGFTENRAMVFYDPDISASTWASHYFVQLTEDTLIINEIAVSPQEINVSVHEASLDIENEDNPQLVMKVSGVDDDTVQGKVKIKDPSSMAETLRNIAHEEVKYYEEQDGNVGMMLANELSYVANGSVNLSHSVNMGDLQSLVEVLQAMVSVHHTVSEKSDVDDSKEVQLGKLATYVDTADSSNKEVIATLLDAFQEVSTTLDEQAQKVHNLDNELDSEEEYFEEDEEPEEDEEIECGVNCDCFYTCEKGEY